MYNLMILINHNHLEEQPKISIVIQPNQVEYIPIWFKKHALYLCGTFYAKSLQLDAFKGLVAKFARGYKLHAVFEPIAYLFIKLPNKSLS